MTVCLLYIHVTEKEFALLFAKFVHFLNATVTPAMACGDYVRGPCGSRCARGCVWERCSVSGCEKNTDSVVGIVLSWTVPAAV